MELGELVRYALERYGIREEHKWAEFPGFSVLVNPKTGKWAALLMRQWDYDRGREVQRCDIRCGGRTDAEYSLPFLSAPYRMRGASWVGVAMEAETVPEAVFALLDRALAPRPALLTVVSPPAAERRVYAETPLFRAPPPDGDPYAAMRAAYAYGPASFRLRCENFLRQGKLMEKQEDNCPWQGELRLPLPTYHDLNAPQLRGYFTWRTCLRRGKARPGATAYFYIYCYELLNGIGTGTPAEAFAALERFYKDYPFAAPEEQAELRRWLRGYAILHALPVEAALRWTEEALLLRDGAIAALLAPEGEEDETIVAALETLAEGKKPLSPLLTGRREEAVPLFAALWRCALRDAPGDFAASILGKPRRQSWKPLPNAVVLETGGGEERAYTLTPCRRYFLRGGFWEEERYEPLYIDRARLRALLREGDRRFRLHLKTGHPTKERPEERWAAPFAEAAIRAVEAARRPALTLALGELDRIRRDAAVTRESLLTEEERGEPEPPPAPAPSPDSPFAPEERAVLRALLRGEDPKPFLTAAKLLPSLLADAVNEALYDAVGDTVLLCEGDTLLLVEDYRAELAELLGEA